MTSLSQQLRNLAVPQTSGLTDLKKRASILFDPKEAATKDRKLIFDLGCSGLADLIALNHEFAQFEDTLFQHTSLHLERSVEDSSFNKQLDKNIKKFFCHLSPYFMLRSSHMCLEWLIRRFQVHEYNKDAFMSLILPYHETNIFVKCVQTLRIKNKSDPWNWIYRIQKPGVILPKGVIINRAANEPSFLSFVCKTVVDFTKELDGRASTLQSCINFYCSVVIGALDNCGVVKEWHMSTILPSILKGLKSDVADFTSASFMITAQLMSKTKFTQKILNLMISQICKVKCESLRSPLVLLLSWIAKTQAEAFDSFPSEGFTDFIANKWLLTTISSLSREGISMHFIIIPLLKTAMEEINSNNENSKACQLFVEGLLYEVQLSPASANTTIRSILETYSQTGNTRNELKDDGIIDLESDTEMESENSTKNWYSKILQILERQYPTELDAVIKEAMQSDNGSKSKSALNVALALRYKFLDADTSSIFQNIYHVNPSIRAISVKELVKGITNGKNGPQHYSLLKETLADRIKDDNENIIKEILKLPTKIFVEVLGYKTFVENLIEILDKANTRPDTWKRVQTTALTHLTSDIITKNYDNHMLLLSVMRFLFPVQNDESSAKYIQLILQSPFAESTPFLQKLAQTLKNKTITSLEFKKDFINSLSLSDKTPRCDVFVESIQNNGSNYFKTAINVSHFLMMATACIKTNNSPEKSHDILNFALSQITRFKITQFKNNQWISATSLNEIPLQLFVDFLLSLVRGTSFGDLLNWERPTKSIQLFLEIFNILTSNALSIQMETSEQQEWTKCLKEIFTLLFPTTGDKLNLLSQFFLYEDLKSINRFTELRLRAIKLLEAILKGGNTISIDLRFTLKVIVALSSPISTVRECALAILQGITAQPVATDLQNFTQQILERSEEIQFDAEQTPLILYTILCNKSKTVKSDKGILEQMLTVINDPTESIVFKSKLLEMLKHIKSTNILNVIIPAALNGLNNTNTDNSVHILDKSAASILKSVLLRLDESCMQKIFTTNDNAWQLIEETLKMPKIFMYNTNDNLIPVPCLTLQIFDEDTYKQLPVAYKIKFLKLVIETISLSDNDVLFLDINKALRRCCIDCEHVLPILESMNNVCGSTKAQQNKQTNPADSINLTTTRQWRDGVILLEVLENKKRLQKGHLLIPILFDILKKCLDMENQSTLEYTKQLVLSALLQSCQRSNSENLLKDIPENTFRIDLIVQCIRVTQNPQTHYNALVLLSHCAELFPQQVLHNLVDIFTFMGSSIARHDDAFSFQVISNIVQSIIPILVREKNSAEESPIHDLVVPVLKIFSDILLDVPEHRRIPLYTKLLNTLGAEQYFWLFLVIVFESHVIHDAKEKLSGKKVDKQSTTVSPTNDKLPKRIEIVLQLLHEFSAYISLQTCVSLIDYVKTIPMNKDETTKSTGSSALNKTIDLELFDVNARSAKQLRHYKYIILQFVSTFTSSVEFLKAVADLNEHENKLIKSSYQQFIIKTLSYIPDITTAVEKSIDTSQSKFWKVILHHCYDALDNVISLLSPDMFLVVVHGLMQHKLLTIRKKIIELLITKLQQKDHYFGNCDEENIINLLRSLGGIIATIQDKQPTTTAFKTNEMIFVQQSALIAVKLLSKLFALRYVEDFKNIVVVLTSIIKKRTSLSKIILATVILTLVEVSSNLKANAISHLPKFMPHLVSALRDHSTMLQKQPPDNVCLALITGIQKLFEVMPLFLGPYIVGIITSLSTIWSRIQANIAEQEPRKTMYVNKLQLIWSKIASQVSARVLIPHCEEAYHILVEDKCYSSISFLMKLLLECMANASNSDLSVFQTELTDFFLKCLEFRAQMSENGNLTNMEEISQTEMDIINAFVAWILKLSESSFRPVYKKVYDWAIVSDGSKERVLTYFIFNKHISSSLKSLFVLFAADFIQDAAELLSSCNSSKNEILYFPESVELTAELVQNILSTLTNIFVHDTKGFSNPHRFDILMQPIVDQLENNLVESSDELQSLLMSCIGQLAIAVNSDVLWKQLNYQILLKTRANVPQIRIIAFKCCVELARKLGDDFTSLLPDTIPFVAELFEDESPQVVKNARTAVQELETILGESLQKYL